MLRIGLVDLGSSHVISFTKRVNQVGIEPEQWVQGARVVAAVPGTSTTHPQVLRIPGHTQQLQEWGVEILERPEELVGRVDAVLLESVDADLNYKRALSYIEAGLPVFVDKVFVTSSDEAKLLVDTAQRKGVPFSAGSSLRHAIEIQEVHRRAEEYGPVLGVDAFGMDPFHTLDTLCALMGTGCRSVRCIQVDTATHFTGWWADGRLATMRLPRRGVKPWGFSAFCAHRVLPTIIDTQTSMRELMRVLVDAFGAGQWPISAEGLVETVAFREAAARSLELGGQEVELAR